jgi:hypothetical protein
MDRSFGPRGQKLFLCKNNTLFRGFSLTSPEKKDILKKTKVFSNVEVSVC